MRTKREPILAQVLQREIPRTVAKTSIEPIHSTGMVQRLLMLYFELLDAPNRNGSQSCWASPNQSIAVSNGPRDGRESYPRIAPEMSLQDKAMA